MRGLILSCSRGLILNLDDMGKSSEAIRLYKELECFGAPTIKQPLCSNDRIAARYRRIYVRGASLRKRIDLVNNPVVTTSKHTHTQYSTKEELNDETFSLSLKVTLATALTTGTPFCHSGLFLSSRSRKAEELTPIFHPTTLAKWRA